mmetsp:Transcript_7795/g.19429  ORF Transcript_7795/g.19429 Transcript_7795/m.19429 type:complete len:90 (-) Transcript_7795:3545-3814(-)
MVVVDVRVEVAATETSLPQLLLLFLLYLQHRGGLIRSLLVVGNVTPATAVTTVAAAAIPTEMATTPTTEGMVVPAEDEEVESMATTPTI